MPQHLTSSQWIEIAQRATKELLRCDDETIRAVYMAAKVNALEHATACYAISPEAYAQAYELELQRMLES